MPSWPMPPTPHTKSCRGGRGWSEGIGSGFRLGGGVLSLFATRFCAAPFGARLVAALGSYETPSRRGRVGRSMDISSDSRFLFCGISSGV